ncbi:hypothetical protein ABPG74_005849 [Tetrahymena malaccensis]
MSSSNQKNRPIFSASVKNLSISTRPQTALAGGGQSLLFPVNQQQKMLREKYPNVTSLSPKSMMKLKVQDDQKSYFSELLSSPLQNQLRNQKSPQAISQLVQSANSQLTSSLKKGAPNNIRVNNELAEYAFEDLIEKEVKISQEEYEEFKRKYHRMVFDKKGNYLYTKLEPKSLEQQRTIQEIYQSKNTSAKLKKDLNERQKNFQPEKIIGNLVKSSQEQATMHPRRKAIQEIKDRAIKSLNEMLNQTVKQKIIEGALTEIQKASTEMNSEVEKLVRENEVLRRDLEKLKDNIVELQTQNENQNWKNSCLVKDIGQINIDFDKLKKNSCELEGFIPQYKLLNSKFPDLDAKQLIFKYEKLENLCLELTKKIAELEDQKHAIDEEKQQIKQIFDRQADDLMLKDINREKQMKMYLEKLKEKEIEIKDAEEYKQNYMLLYKKIQKIFIDWNSQIKVYPLEKKDDNGPKANIKDPMEILDIMEKEIKISTPDKLQEYLRKIIVSANLLQRKYLPEYVNEKFDPDKIYERILKLVNKLNAENFKLKAQIKQLKRTDSFGHDGANDKQKGDLNDSRSYLNSSLTKNYQYDE